MRDKVQSRFQEDVKVHKYLPYISFTKRAIDFLNGGKEIIKRTGASVRSINWKACYLEGQRKVILQIIPSPSISKMYISVEKQQKAEICTTLF